MTENDREERGERVVRCPVEGCTAEKLARGMHLHILRSVGDGHGDQDEYPGGVTRENLTEVGRETVDVDYPDERESESVARLCPYCRQPFSGKEGVMIHLGLVAGRKGHPENASEVHDPDDFPEAERDADENLTAVSNSGVTFADTGSAEQLDEGVEGEEPYMTLTKSQVNRLYAALRQAEVEDTEVERMLQRAYLNQKNREG
jgi:hypothetical protein